MKTITKLIKVTLWFVLLIIVGANLSIIFTGRFYIYKGISATYLKGHVQPTIYDDDVFNNRIIEKGNVQEWLEHPKLGTFTMSEKQYDYIESLNPASFLVAWGDTIIFEEYWGVHNEDKLGNSFSMAKSVVSLLIGAAIEDGYIQSIDEPVAYYLEEFSKNGKEVITIRHVLTMSSGLSWSEDYFNPFCDVAELYYDTDAEDLTLNRRSVESNPGETFKYKSGDFFKYNLITRNWWCWCFWCRSFCCDNRI